MKIDFLADGIIKLISENNVEEYAINTWIKDNAIDADAAIADHDWKNAKVECATNDKDHEINKLKEEIAKLFHDNLMLNKEIASLKESNINYRN